MTPLVDGRAGGAHTLKTDSCDGSWEVLLTVPTLGSVKLIRFVMELLCVHTERIMITLASMMLVLSLGVNVKSRSRLGEFERYSH